MKSPAPLGSGRIVASLRRSHRFQAVVLLLLAPGLLVWDSPLQANPHGGRVVHGDVSIGAGHGGNLQIRQNSRNAIIHWESFSIASGETTQFRQSGPNAAVLNRVTGGDPSAIHGALKANGNVFVINPNGILVGAGGTIDVHGLVLSTLDVEDGEFLARSDLVFKGSATSGGVTNLGRINAIGGDVFLIGRTVANSGTVRSEGGRAGLAAGEEVLLKADDGTGGERLFVRATGAGGTGVLNDGTIEGAAVELKAHGNLYALAINNKGSVRATGTATSGGRVYLRGAGGTVDSTGTIRASSSGTGSAGRALIEAAYAKVDGMIRTEGGDVRISATESVELGGRLDVSNAVGRGGNIVVEGTEISLGSTASVDASGGAGGGSVRVGGGFQGRDAEVRNAERLVVSDGATLRADSTGDGDAGTVILWSDGRTDFAGTVSAGAVGAGNGGFVEVSGKNELLFEGMVSTLSAGGGRAGTLLLDPTDFQIVGGTAGVNQINNTTLSTQLAGGNVVISTSDASASDPGTITVEANAGVSWNADTRLTLLAHQDIDIYSSIQNNGGGGILLVAGWDGTTHDPGATIGSGSFLPGDFPFASYGARNGTVTLSGSNAGVSVGSRAGFTHVSAYGLELLGAASGGGRYAQLGFAPTAAGAVTGSLSANLKEGGLTLTAGGVDGAFAQVGHGGSYAVDTTVGGMIDISFAADFEGDVKLTASATTTHAYAQIGHGGNDWDGSKSGAITINRAKDILLAGGGGGSTGNSYAQIGHGGTGINSAWGSGTAGGSISLTNTRGKVSLTAGGGANGYAQVGHGGIIMSGGHSSGDIEVHAGTGGILIQGGGGTRATAQIGHGSYNGDGNSISGNVTVLAKGTAATDGIVMRGGAGTRTAAMIGGGGHIINNATITGNTTVEVQNGGLSMTGGSGSSSFVAIGHGTDADYTDNTAATAMSGTVGVTVRGGDLALKGGTNTGTNAQIGHGGYAINGNRSDDITVTVAGGVSVASGGGQYAYAQIGHGGYDVDGNLSGKIAVTAQSGAAKVDATGGGADSYAQIGHGGSLSNGNKGVAGDIVSVTAAGNVEVFSGSRDRTYAMIGNGGYEADAVDTTNGGSVADVTVRAGTGGTGSVLLRGSSLSGATSSHSFAFVQIGNGGLRSNGRHSGAIQVDAAGDIVLHIGKDSWNYAQIGHGGYQADAPAAGLGHFGDITLTTDNGSVRIMGSSFDTSTYHNTPAYAQVGHGGHESDGNHQGNIAVTSGDQIRIDGGTPDNAYKQIGHGGIGAKGNFSGSIAATAVNHIDVLAGTNDGTYAQIGHGGLDADGNHTADFIQVTSTNGAIRVIAGWAGQYIASAPGAAGDKSNAYAQIGLGGGRTSGTMSAPIFVSAAGGIELEAGGSDYNYAQIGNGGYLAGGDKSGAIEVVSTGGSVSVKGAARKDDTYAMIGHGGVGVHGTLRDDIAVSAANGVAVLGGSREAVGSFAQIGHGGLDSDGNKSGAVEVDSDSDGNGTGGLTIAGGSADRAYALIGHGGLGSDGFIDGRIGVNVGGDLTIRGGSGATAGQEGNFNFAQIGHSLAGAVGGFGGFTESGGRVVVEGEMFHSATGWVALPEGTVSTHQTNGTPYQFANVRGWGYVQAPDSSGIVTGTGASASAVDYRFTVTQSGTYRLIPRKNGYDEASDSAFFSIVELKDGAGGNADWYEFTSGGSFGGSDGNFRWDNSGGGFEETGAGDSNGPPLWNLTAGQTYTMRVTAREDGVAVDAWMLQLDGMAAPTGLGPGVTFTHASGVSGASDIDVTVGGNISLTGGANSDSHAAIGHGGSSFAGVNSNLQYGSASDGADISVVSRGGNILLDGNATAPDLAGAARRYAVIGHHGVDAGFDAYGDVAVHAQAGTVTLRGGNAADSFAAVGHSGGGNFLDGISTRQGEICVVGTNGIGLGLSGTGARSYAQIGHGGHGVAGNFGGDIAAVAPNGAVALAGGAGTGQYAQIGHGGIDADGDLAGDIRVVAGGGALSLAGGSHGSAYAMTGHGDGAGTSDGTRQGGIHLFASSQISATDGGSEAHLFHQSGGDLSATDYLGGDGLQAVGNGGLAVSDAALRGVNTMIAGNWSQGPISLAFSNDIDLVVRGGSHAVTTSDEFYLMTGGSIAMEAGYQNAGDGGVFLVAGWNGSGATFNGSVSYAGGDFCEPQISVGDATFDFNACGNFGHNNGTVTIGNASQSTGVAVGSRAGQNVVAAHGLTLQGSNTTLDSFSQLGFRTNGSGQATGAIDVRLKQGGLRLTGGNAVVMGDHDNNASTPLMPVQGGSYAQIGHGGTGAAANGVNAAISISFCEAGGVLLDGGEGLGAYAQVGHGGYNLDHTNTGNITISNALNADLNAGRGRHADARVGHGGYDADGSHNGRIEITAANFIDVDGGWGLQSVGQIGHGGFSDSSGNNTGDIVLTTTAASGGIRVRAGSSTVGSHTASYGQIGHGGYQSGGTLSGDIVLDSAGEIAVSGGDRDLNYKLIGHGGYGSTSPANGAIHLKAVGNIDVLGGTNDYAFAQIGHGGSNSSSNKNAASVGGSGVADGIHVTSTGGTIRVHGGDQGGRADDGRFAYAQIGMGGTFSGGPFNGAIHVSAATGVDVSGGGRDHNYARIGHGGDRTSSAGTNTRIGNITVSTTAGNVRLAGGTRKEFNSASIGHGGYNLGGSSTGSIRVSADAGKVILTAGGGDDAVQTLPTTGDHSYSSAQIGHGVANVVSGDLTGDICVVGYAGVEMSALPTTAGEGERAQTQIGHGGYNARGNFSGAISVVAPDGSVTLSGGQNGSEGQYSQIGHGGLLADGELRGNITVVAGNGDTRLTGGNGAQNYAMIGHGDGAKTSSGQRQGGVHLFSSGQLIGTNGSGADSNVWIFHQNSNGLLAADYLGGDGYQKIAIGGMSMEASALVHESTMISGNLGSGLIQIVDNSDTDYVIDASNIGIGEINTSADFYIVTGGNITMLTSYQNAGTGDVILVAGWDKTSGTVGAPYVAYGDSGFCHPILSAGDFTMDFNNCGAFGNDGRTITIGSSSQTERVVVGSRGGSSIFAAHGIVMEAGNSHGAFSQLGFRPTAAAPGATGDIALHVKEGGVRMTAGTGVNDSFVQIGHGGTGAANSTISGDISIDFCAPGDVVLTAGGGGAGRGNYAQIGHGGNNWDAIKSGAISIDGANDVSLFGGRQDGYAQIGHGGSKDNGGSYGSGAATGDISVVNTAGKVTLLAGDGGENGYVQIGHGGVAMAGSASGEIEVHSGTGGILVQGGAGNRATAQIGNGGYNSDNPISGAVTVLAKGTGTADGIVMQGGSGISSAAMIGGGHYLVNNTTITGSTTVEVRNGGLSMAGGSGQYAYVTIGHGNRADASNMGASHMSGSVNVNVLGGDLTLKGGSNQMTSAQIGHGGNAIAGNRSGDIAVEVAGGISVASGTGSHAYAQIGHGGYGSNGSLLGAIEVTANGGPVEVDASGGGQDAYGQIGHGGSQSRGNFEGDIALTNAGDVLLEAGQAGRTYALVGHGGAKASAYLSGDIDVRSTGSVSLKGGDGAAGGSDTLAFAQIGHSLQGGTSGYGDFIAIDGRFVIEAEHYASNPGGRWVLTGEGSAHPGSPFVNSRGGEYLLFPDPVGGQSWNSTGHMVTYEIRVDAAQVGQQYLIMPRWTGFDGNSDSIYITVVDSNGNVVALDAPTGAQFASWTDGGANMDFDNPGWSPTGYPGAGTPGTAADRGPVGITFNSAGVYTLRVNAREDGAALDALMLQEAGLGTPTRSDYAETFEFRSGIEGTVTVVAGQDIDLQAGAGAGSYASIGHRGNDLDFDASGDVHVEGRNIALAGGAADGSSAQIGHGGKANATGTIGGTVHVRARGDLSLRGGGSANQSNALIGHGDLGMAGTRSGDVRIRAAGSTLLADGSGSSAILGHAGTGSTTGSTDFAFVTGTLDNTGATSYGLGDTIARMLPNGSIDIGVQQGDLIIDGADASADTSKDIDLYAGGDVRLRSSIQNAGNGSANLVAGWDGTTGLTESYPAGGGDPVILDLRLEIADLLADSASWGNNGGKATVGDGSQSSGIAFGAAGGATTVLGHSVEVLGSDTTANGHAQIGTVPSPGVSPTGAITVLAREGGVSVEGGDQTGAHAQIGHRGIGSTVSALSGDIRVESLGGLSLEGGGNLLSYAQIGHGGNSATIGTIGGNIAVSVLEDIVMEGGPIGGAYVQIGHGGLFTHGNFGGDVAVEAGGSLSAQSPGAANAAYAKIGHGDDARGAFSSLGGTGTRDGDLSVAAGTDLTMAGALIGHVNAESPATAIGGRTWIGVARSQPDDPDAGTLAADAASEFSGAEEVRLYLPRRASNEVAASAKINGQTYDGGVADPWPVQRPDESTNYLQTDSGTTQPGEHDNAMGSGPALPAGGYAFHYDLVVLGGSFPVDPNLPVDPGNPTHPEIPQPPTLPTPPPVVGPDYLGFFLDDRAYDDWLRSLERLYSGPGSGRILYEGYPQYGPYGESIYNHR